ncbi:glutathionylspermidine synthase family protein [Marinobacter mangrovi]|uniref:glutathionylspermidine synthase family protein n=1 Tax=Marinobacter mangrovi TaxID=2803918 RepID=UPI0019325FCB|nr:glutathionylspermidine synthase family protein [Marinobacter mangrovi]
MQRNRMQPRHNWCSRAKELGFHFHTIDGEPYWDESACYRFTLQQIERDIEDPTAEIHGMCLELVDEVVKSDRLMRKLALPEAHWDLIRTSWRDGEPSLYGRIDLAYDGVNPAKLYEYNADTPTSLYETGFFQWIWLEECKSLGQLPPEADQFNSLQEALIERLAYLGVAGKPLHIACTRGHDEDRGTISYLADLATQAGLSPVELYMDDIGLSGAGRFVDLEDKPIDQLFKLYPWEWIWEEAFATSIATAGTQFIEPPWKAILSNKGILPLLWERHRGHPNLLPAWFTTDEMGTRQQATRWVRKPFFSREGANIQVETPQGVETSVEGPYDSGPHIFQAWHPPTQFAGHFTLIGSWLVGRDAVGMSIREDDTAITRDSSRFVPHCIIG